MEQINKGQPSAYDIVFPVFGGNLNDEGHYVPNEIYGTAFYIKNNFFVTCAHTIKHAGEQGIIALGYQNEQGSLSFVTANDTEEFEKNDSGIIQTHIPRAAAHPWLKQKLAMLNDVVSTGYPYGFDNANGEILIRSFKGHIILVGFNHNFSKSPQYELSYQVPRGLSGGPLLFVTPQGPFLCGMTIGNEITDMVVYSFKEKDQQGEKLTIYERTEALHRGIAMQPESFFDIKSGLLGATFYDYLNANALLK